LILKSKVTEGKIDIDVIDKLKFYSPYEEGIEVKFAFNSQLAFECRSQDELDELLELLDINKDILTKNNMSYNKLLKDLILTKSVFFDIIVKEDGSFQLIY
jgi:hypothetical protein